MHRELEMCVVRFISIGSGPFGKGVIRVAVLVNELVHVLRTSKYKGVSD